MYATTLNKNTKKARAWIAQYENCTNYSLDDVYTRYSTDKARAEYRIKMHMTENGQHGYKVLSGNSCFFTVGFLSRNGEKLYILTAKNTYQIKL